VASRQLLRETVSAPPGVVVRAVAFSPDGQALAFAGEDTTAPPGGRGIVILQTRDGPRPSWTAGESITNLAFSPNGRKLAWVCEKSDRKLHLLDRDSKQELPPLPGHQGDVLGLAFHPSGQQIATGSRDKMVRLWDCGGFQLRESLPSETAPEVFQVAFTPEGRYLATANGNGTITILRLARCGKVCKPR
jgi:WD40 repeat protein